MAASESFPVIDPESPSSDRSRNAIGHDWAALVTGCREIRHVNDIQSDLQTLRDEFRRLAEQVGEVITAKGSAAWQQARPAVDSVVSDAQKKGREAVDAVGDVSDNFVAAIDESIKNRPYTTLAIFAGLGFVLGAMWRR